MGTDLLITGSSGMIGTAASKQLIHDGYDICGVDNHPNHWSVDVDNHTCQYDLSDPDSLSQLASPPDMILHLAAHARVHESVQDSRLAHENYQMTASVLDYASKYDVDVIFASSREVYGKGGPTKRDEGKISINRCASPYAASKLAGEALVHSYANSFGIRATVLRFSNVYGRYDDTDRVIPLFIAQANQNHDLTIHGREKILDFTYIDDCISGIVQTIEKFDAVCGQTINLASGSGHSLFTVAETIVEEIGSRSTIKCDSNRSGEICEFVADIERAKSILDYEPAWSLETGLERTIEWYLNRPAVLNNVFTNQSKSMATSY